MGSDSKLSEPTRLGTRGGGGLWTPSYSPSSLRWWHTVLPSTNPIEPEYGHFGVLLDMLSAGGSAEDAEALSWCHDRVVVEGAGHRVTGEWCVCLSENPPSAGEARGHVGGDGKASLIAVKADLEEACNQLPISWSSTQAIYEAQGRNLLYQGRLLTYRQNLRVREIDRWLEPRNPDTGRPQSRSLALFMMSVSLGGRSVCDWPKKDSIVSRDVFSAKLAAHQLAAIQELPEAA